MGDRAAERRGGVDRLVPVVPAPRVSQLVREGEALPRPELAPVDPEHRTVAVAMAGTGDAVGQRGDDHREPGPRLDGVQEAGQRRGGIEPERRARLARALRPAVGVQAGHSAPWSHRRCIGGPGG